MMIRSKFNSIGTCDVVVIGVDPGVTTGVSIMRIRDISQGLMPTDVDQWWSGQYTVGGSGDFKTDEICKSEQEMSWRIAEHIMDEINLAKYTFVAIEDFIPRRMDSSRDFLSPVRVTAGVKQEIFQMDYKPAVKFFQPSNAKTTCSDARMDNWGFKIPNQRLRHSRDADRHAALMLRTLADGKVSVKDRFYSLKD